MHILSLGYLGFAAADLAEWRDYATGFLGLQAVADGRDGLALRLDEYRHRLLFEAGDAAGALYYGWEVADPGALDVVCAGLERAGVTVERGRADELERRGVADMAWCRDPEGNRVELFHGLAAASDAFAPGRPVGGFRAGHLGLGHVLLLVERAEPMVAFYRDVLGMRLSDWMQEPFRATFLHCNPRHHSIAFVEAPRRGLHHVMFELNAFDDVGQAYDLAQETEGRVAVTLGRHANDHMFSFYAKTPGSFLVEYGWGGRLVEDATWRPSEIHGPSLWGHERSWLTPEERIAARSVTRRFREEGRRAPVHVEMGPDFEIARWRSARQRIGRRLVPRG